MKFQMPDYDKLKQPERVEPDFPLARYLSNLNITDEQYEAIDKRIHEAAREGDNWTWSRDRVGLEPMWNRENSWDAWLYSLGHTLTQEDKLVDLLMDSTNYGMSMVDCVFDKMVQAQELTTKELAQKRRMDAIATSLGY